MKALIGLSALITSLVSVANVARAECVSNMYAINNKLIASFKGFDCTNAKFKCDENLRWRHQHGQNPYARCVIGWDVGRDDQRCVGTNIWGSYAAGGGCNTFGCFKAGGGCGAFGCYEPGGGCGAFGCWTRGGRCGAFGCTNGVGSRPFQCRK